MIYQKTIQLCKIKTKKLYCNAFLLIKNLKPTSDYFDLLRDTDRDLPWTGMTFGLTISGKKEVHYITSYFNYTIYSFNKCAQLYGTGVLIK